MDLSNEIDGLLTERRQQVLNGAGSIIEIFRENFVQFEKLIGFYKRHRSLCIKTKKSAFREIGELLEAKGVRAKRGPLSDTAIGSYMSQVRAERSGKPKQRRAVQPVGEALPPKMVPTPAIGGPGGAVQVVVAPTGPVVELETLYQWLVELNRLKKEEPEAVWTAQDQWILNFFEKIAEPKNWDLSKNFNDMVSELTPEKKNTFIALMAKKERRSQ